ncbi:MAG: Isocitrate dehydrogenase [NAD] subunit alpha, mitochondrial, partial [Paramarteilia canceri]
VPIKWEEIDPSPIPDASGAYKIPSSVINSIKRNKIALKGPLQTPIGKGIRSLNLALRK